MIKSISASSSYRVLKAISVMYWFGSWYDPYSFCFVFGRTYHLTFGRHSVLAESEIFTFGRPLYFFFLFYPRDCLWLLLRFPGNVVAFLVTC